MRRIEQDNRDLQKRLIPGGSKLGVSNNFEEEEEYLCKNNLSNNCIF
jgi:hypothetical protein